MSIIPTRNNNRNPNSRFNLRGIRLFQKILQDWFPVICLLSLRKVVISEIKKVLSCKDQRFCTVFGCSECGHIKRVPFTCRSRFCPSCGALYHSQRASSMSEKLLNFLTVTVSSPFLKTFATIFCKTDFFFISCLNPPMRHILLFSMT